MLLLPSQFFLGLDCLHYIILEIKDSLSTPMLFILQSLRFLLLGVNCFEICRVFSLLILIFVSGLRILANIMSNLKKRTGRCPSSVQIQRLLEVHIKTQLAYKPVAPFQELGTLSLMTEGLLIFIFSNFGTVKFFKLLPLVVYIFFPCVSITVAFDVNLTLPFAHKLKERSEELLNIWSWWGWKGGKRLVKKLRATRPFVLYAGVKQTKLFGLTKEVKLDFYSQGAEHTINLLLSVPDSAIQKVAHLAWFFLQNKYIYINLYKLNALFCPFQTCLHN